jgi:hypothetical protein
MTQHLRPEEFVDALDGLLASERRSHLDSCDECRVQFVQLRSAELEAGEDAGFEPSPLFWDHFNARVHEATTSVDITPRRWWHLGWQQVAVVGAAAAVIALAVMLRPGQVNSGSGTLESEMAVLPRIEDDGSWDIMLGMASEVAWDDVREVVTPSVGAADAAIEELTASQREELIRLLKKEIGVP